MRLHSVIFLLLSLSCAALSVAFADDAPVDLNHHPGRAIYTKLCVECHGDEGEGVEGKADDPLIGNRDLSSLAGRIERTMPEDKEDLCVGPDAKAVAEYIYHAFYSAEAQARLIDVKKSFTRLTVPQHKNSIMDLISSFRNGYHVGLGDKRGLKGDYYGGYKYNTDKEKKGADRFDRTDPWLKFDFGNQAPRVPEGKELQPGEFSIRWSGGLIAQETGTYEFVIKTRNGAVLQINESDFDATKTVDAWVSPNNEIREVRGSIFLQGGRVYPVRIDFFKYKEDKAYFELLWKPPHGVEQTIPTHVLTPDRYYESMVVETPFPADDRSFGYERGSSVSQEWFDAVTSSAFEAADYIANHLDELAGIKKDDPERAKKIGEFGVAFTSRAFRRPLTEEERVYFVDRRFQEADSLEKAVRRLVLLTLTSPRFLYPDSSFESMEGPWAKSASLALTLWDSVPDAEWIKRTQSNRFRDPKKWEEEARRMVWDRRTRDKLNGFFHHWLELDRAYEISKDSKLFPDFSPEVMADLRTSLDLFLEQAIWTGSSDYRQLILADSLFLNSRLSKIYGDGKDHQGFQKVSLPPQNRAGVITHPYLLTSLAYHDNTSPIHRGVFLTRNIVGIALKPPPEATEFKDSDFDPTLTMREKVTELTRSKACMACHSMINPLGFSLETFDAMGRFRQKELNKAINDDSELKTDDGTRIQIKGPRDVAEFAANSPTAHRAFVRQLFHHFVKQPTAAYGPNTLDDLQKHFTETNFNVSELLVRIAITAAQGKQP